MYREVFIFVVGTTPQVVTETLYAMLHKDPSVYPDEIFLITTQTGSERIERDLLSSGKLKDFYDEFNVKFVNPQIVHLTDRNGNILDDIRTEEDNENVGDFIVDFVKTKASDPGSRLHCSMAGGRKTMGFYLGSALGLFGRPWDKLYHVLVTSEFESHPDFYWKPTAEKVLQVRGPDGKVLKRLNTKDAGIFLAELPFIRFRDKFTLDGQGFRELVREGQKEVDTATSQKLLKADIAERTLRIGETIIEMVPMEIVVYTAFLRRKLRHCLYPERPYCLDCTDCYSYLVDLSSRRALEEMAGDYKKAYGHNVGRVEEFFRRWPDGIGVEALRQYISKINKTIKEQLKDDTICIFYTISAVGRHGNKRHGIRVEKGKIRVR